MRVSTSKSEAMIHCWKTENCTLWVGSELLPQVKAFKYLRLLFKSEFGRQIVLASAVMLPSYCIVVVKRELRWKAGLTLSDRSSDIWRELKLEPLILCIERSLLSCFFGRLSRELAGEIICLICLGNACGFSRRDWKM